MIKRYKSHPIPDLPVRSLELTTDLQFDTTDVEKLLSALVPNSAPGPDELHPLLLQKLADIVAAPIAHIFRLSLDEGHLPNEWKEAVVRPIHKGGQRQLPENYRPISLTSVLCKVLERLVKKRLAEHLERLSLLSTRQHGFRQNRSCITNLLWARESWINAVDNGNRIDVIFVDFSRAFDKVPHQRLIRKLGSYGIQGKLLTWISNFLTNRSIRVKVNDVISTPVSVSSGVPQGSVLGPELFKIYVNDLPDALNIDSLLYADDLKLWASVSSNEEADYIQSALTSLHNWSITWELPVNYSKCSVLPIGANDPFARYYIGDNPLNPVSSERDLGVVVTWNLKTSLETSRKVASASRLLGAIRRSFTRMSPELFRKLYVSHVRPVLEFGQPATNPITKGECDLLERVQRRGSKVVKGFRHLPYEERLQRLGLFSLGYRRRRGDLIYTRRILNGELGPELLSFFLLNNEGMTRGHQFKLYKIRRHRLHPRMTLSSRVVNDWNNLPAPVVEATSEARFKELLDTYMKNGVDMGAS